MCDLRFCRSEQRKRGSFPEDAGRAGAGAAQPRQASDQLKRVIRTVPRTWHSAHSATPATVAIRLEDLVASFRPRWRVAGVHPFQLVTGRIGLDDIVDQRFQELLAKGGRRDPGPA